MVSAWAAKGRRTLTSNLGKSGMEALDASKPCPELLFRTRPSQITLVGRTGASCINAVSTCAVVTEGRGAERRRSVSSKAPPFTCSRD